MAIPGANLGIPPAPGGVTWSDARLLDVLEIQDLLYAFVLMNGTNAANQTSGYLYCRMCVDGAWLEWAFIGAPVQGLNFQGSYQGASATAGNLIYVFIPGNDGHLWCAYWSGPSWQWVDLGQPKDSSGNALWVALVDNAVSSPLSVTVSVNGAPWGAFWGQAGWYWSALPTTAPFQRRTNSVIQLNVNSAFYTQFQIQPDYSLVCGAHALAGITTSGFVQILVDSCSFPPAVGVRGINVDGSYAAAVLPVSGDATTATLDLRNASSFKEGAICWAFCVDSTATAAQSLEASFNLTSGGLAVGGAMGMMGPCNLLAVAALALPDFPFSIPSQTISGRESQANFNFTPSQPGVAIGYALSSRTYFPLPGVPAWYSWSSASNFPDAGLKQGSS